VDGIQDRTSGGGRLVHVVPQFRPWKLSVFRVRLRIICRGTGIYEACCADWKNFRPYQNERRFPISVFGFANWQDIDDDTANLPNSTGYGGSVTNSFWSYIPGITVDGVSQNLNFQDQDVLNANYNNTFKKNITGTCALVAITNMFIYYEYIGFDNALLYDSVEYTFDRALTEINWLEWSDSNWWRNTVSGLKSMASKAGYDYKINEYNNLKWNDVTSSIDSDMPIFTYIYAEQTDGYEFAHAVVTVGYEEFIHKYTTTEQYWLFGWKEKTVEHEDMYRYLRVVDGWSSSNDSRYIDFNGFFTTVKVIAFMLEE
jgi:hypothetical protein